MNVKTRTWTKKTVQRSKRMTIPDRDRKKAIIYPKGYPFRIWVGIALHRGPQVLELFWKVLQSQALMLQPRSRCGKHSTARAVSRCVLLTRGSLRTVRLPLMLSFRKKKVLRAGLECAMIS